MTTVKKEDIERELTLPAMLNALLHVLFDNNIVDDTELMEEFTKEHKKMIEKRIEFLRASGYKVSSKPESA